MASRKNVPASVVRAWAAENGITVGARGRFTPDVLAAFHKANKGHRYSGPILPVRVVKGTRVTESGRKVPVQKRLTVADVRAAAAAAGVTLNTGRGRLPHAAWNAAAGIGTWEPLKASQSA